MDNIATNLEKAKKYEVHNIFGNDKFPSLVSGLRLAECMKAEASYLEDQSEVQGIVIIIFDFIIAVYVKNCSLFIFVLQLEASSLKKNWS